MRRLALLAALPAALAAAPRPVPALPAEHPRLYLRAQHVEDLRRRTEHPTLKPVWEELQALGKKNVQIALEVDALRYLLTRDADLGQRTAAAALETLESATFDLPTGRHAADRPADGHRRRGLRLVLSGAHAGAEEGLRGAVPATGQQLECGYPPRETAR